MYMAAYLGCGENYDIATCCDMLSWSAMLWIVDF